ncbi:alpha-(1-_3)-arabinofuranosyltransferase domain-containing protein [Aldersonia kunmingensis]|uniref:alpha-(1->3)-arabinofuranosyltransferase domain-containing protein n=1 Tax=Aldersonia kunmingensis TaxID=408066 RepID=UPI00082CBF07
MTSPTPSVEPLDRRWFIGAALIALLLAFLQSPGKTVADTKYDLTQDPLGFLARASHLWNSEAPLGQVQNQAYGYFFPHGSFFGLGQLLSIPPWITQRIWWALLLLVGFWGIIRLAEALGIGNRGSRVIAALAFVLCPRVLTTLGSISSESLPMMLAPWVLLPVVRAFGREPGRLRVHAASSAGAVALMGAVNAVATVAAVAPAVLWWLSSRPNRRWWRFTVWWVPALLLATLWWIVPLLLLGRFSPPFLDYIESSGITTQWASLAEVLRGTTSWTPFVSPERVAGTILVTQSSAVIATGVVAAAGMAGLAMRSNPIRGRLALILLIGIAGITAGYLGELSSPIAESVRIFLDSGGAPLRNVHKLEPLIRLPLVLGLAHLLTRVPLPGSVPFRTWRYAFAHPEHNPMIALTGLLLVALTLATAVAWTGRLAPRGAYDEVPEYWHQAANWLAANADSGGAAPDERALVVPGAPFAAQVWGLTRDEPLQALAQTPWAVRDAVPLTPPGAIRALDSVQRLIADGRPSSSLAETLRAQGIGFLVLRNDLDPDTSRSARPVLAHQAIEGSPGLTKVAEFGEEIAPRKVEHLVVDGDLRVGYPAIEIFRVDAGATGLANEPYLVDAADLPIVAGGPEALLRMHQSGETGSALLAADAERAGLRIDTVTVTDTPVDRETDFGQVDYHSSAIRAVDESRRTFNRVPDYPVDGAPLVRGEWSGATITTSSAAADATQLGGVAPGAGPTAVIDGDESTSWFSNGLESAVGQWLRLDLDNPIKGGLLHVTVNPATIGSPVKWLEIQTQRGSTAARVGEKGKPLTIALPPGETSWVRILATQTTDGSVGFQFSLSEVSIDDYTDPDNPVPVEIRHRTVLPPPPAGADVRGWDLGQELVGRTSCVETTERVRCSTALQLAPEELNAFQRTLDVPAAVAVAPEVTLRSRPSLELDALLAQPGRPLATGAADTPDPRGSAIAATDGDPRTTWTAPANTVRRPAGPKPTLTIELPEKQLVTGLTLESSLGRAPARPTSVAVDLGAGPQVREVGVGPIELFPYVTDRIELSIQSWDELHDLAGIGFTQPMAPGFAEIEVLGADGKPIGPPADLDRMITVPCEDGPKVTIAGQTMQLSITATADQLRSGAPVSARPCAADTAAALPAGRPDIEVLPGPAFFVDSMRLKDIAAAPAQVPATTPLGSAITTWTADEREIDVAATDRDRLLVVPESTNPGWRARTNDGTELATVVVNGWQQGWIVPAGTAGPITLDFPLDRWYRTAIFGGLALLLVLLGLALWRRGSLGAASPAPRPWRSTVVAAAGVLAVATVISGPVGTALAAAGLAGSALAVRRWGARVTAWTLTIVAGGGTIAATAWLSRAPWRSPEGYLGHSLWVQLPALLAVIAVGVAVVPFPRWLRRRSQDRTQRRTGSSTIA